MLVYFWNVGEKIVVFQVRRILQGSSEGVRSGGVGVGAFFLYFFVMTVVCGCSLWWGKR